MAELPANGERFTNEELTNEVTNEQLSKALESKQEFTNDEWKQFGIDRLQMRHWIRSGGKYFQPAEDNEVWYFTPIGHLHRLKTKIMKAVDATIGDDDEQRQLEKLETTIAQVTTDMNEGGHLLGQRPHESGDSSGEEGDC